MDVYLQLDRELINKGWALLERYNQESGERLTLAEYLEQILKWSILEREKDTDDRTSGIPSEGAKKNHEH